MRRLCLTVSVLIAALGLVLGAAAPAGAKKLHPHRGGKVRLAWPKTKRGKPSNPLARFLARQVSGKKPRKKHKGKKHGRAPFGGIAMRRGGDVVSIDKGVDTTGQKLQLVRSFDIPKDDPSYDRLLNRSFTYDSALAATAFSALGNKAEAAQLLDQLTALQRTDGSIDFSFNTYTGSSDPLFRAGTIAEVGIAAETYDGAFGTTAYSKLSEGVRNWLLTQQGTDGLIRGGPDVKFESTQHNLLAWFFFTQFAKNHKGKGAAAAQKTADVIAAAIDANLLSKDGGLHFRQGAGDDTPALDPQTFGIFYLLARGQKDEASQVADWMQKNLSISGLSIDLSGAKDSYNMTYSAPGPFEGFRPYAGEGTPDIIWMEGTLEARLALAQTGRDTSALDKNIELWREVAGSDVGPLMSNRTVTYDNNEYHVWPVSATASWILLNDAGFSF